MRVHKFTRGAVLVLLASFGSAVTGCSSNTSYSKTAVGFSNEQGTLTRSDLNIGPRMESTATGTYLFFGLLSFGGDPQATAYNTLLGKMPEADEITGVSTKFDNNGFAPFFWTSTATVYGKPVTIKTDSGAPMHTH